MRLKILNYLLDSSGDSSQERKDKAMILDLYKAGVVDAEWPDDLEEPKFRINEQALRSLIYTVYAESQTPIEC